MEPSLKILMLEDSLIDFEIIKRELLKSGRPCIFNHAKNEQEFLTALDDFTMDIILSDNSLPQFSAKEALQVVQHKNLNVPFIIVTGTMSEEFAAASIKAGADDYVLKDRLARLNAAIDAALLKKQTEKEKRKILHQLIKSEEQYRSLVERISDGFMALDTSLKITYVNKVAAELLGKKTQELTGNNLYEILPEAKNSNIHLAFQAALNTSENIYIDDYSVVLQKWIMGSIYPSPSGVSVYFRDITEKKKLEQELEEQKKVELLHLTAARLEAQEKERNTIAEELHDNVNQILVGTSMVLKQVITNPQKHIGKLEVCVDYLSEAITENRKIAHELVTPDLAKTGLLMQVKKLTETMLLNNDIEVNIVADNYNEHLLNDKQMLASYRIVQEQCTNIVKHAMAKLVTIELATPGDHKFIMKIFDNGVGITAGEKNKGIGLLNISSRLSLLKGQMRIATAEGGGFLLETEFPV